MSKFSILIITGFVIFVSCVNRPKYHSLLQEYAKAKEYAYEEFSDSLMSIFPKKGIDSTSISFGCGIYNIHRSKSYYYVDGKEKFPWEYGEEHHYSSEAEYYRIKDSLKCVASLQMTPSDEYYVIYKAVNDLPHPKYPEHPIFVPEFKSDLFPIDSTTVCLLPREAEIYIDKIGYHQIIFDEEAENEYMLPEIGHGYETGAAFLDEYLWSAFWVMAW